MIVYSSFFNERTNLFSPENNKYFIKVYLILSINYIIYKMTELKNVAIINFIHAIILILLSIALNMVGG